MPRGSCLCGDFTYEYKGKPNGVSICHCIPCRKTAGSNGSYNVLIPNDQFKKLSGETSSWTRKGDTGKDVTYNKCATCGTIMYVDAEALGPLKVLKGGTLDDHEADNANKPVVEIYIKNRPTWCTAWPIEQHESA